MNLETPFDNNRLTYSETALLRKGNFQTVADLLSTTTQDIAKRCKASPLEVKRIVDKVLDATPSPKLDRLDALNQVDNEKFTTGDDVLDKALGGGIRTGMVWEVVGESAAGKTQLALQLSLFIQAPPELGGLSGSTCYLTTSSTLPTERLLQISEANQLSPSSCSLEHVHTLATPTVAVLERVLTDILPSFIEKHATPPGGKPVKLVVIDAIGELFHSSSKTTTSTLVERSKDIAKISASLHWLARKHHIAILVLNEVIDVFDRTARSQDGNDDLFYQNQSRWFNTAEFFGEGKKEACLGLVWANQVNARIMLSRTGRRKYLSNEDLPKRRRLQKHELVVRAPVLGEEQASLIRRLSVIFSAVSSPAALDYIVNESGISVLQEDALYASTSITGTLGQGQNLVNGPEKSHIPPSDDVTQGIANTLLTANLQVSNAIDKTTLVEGDEFDLWTQGDSYENFDWDALEENLGQIIP